MRSRDSSEGKSTIHLELQNSPLLINPRKAACEFIEPFAFLQTDLFSAKADLDCPPFSQRAKLGTRKIRSRATFNHLIDKLDPNFAYPHTFHSPSQKIFHSQNP